MERQPIHTLYGGAHLFTRDTIVKMGLLAVRQLLDTAPECFRFAEGLQMPEAVDFPRTENGRISLLRRFRRRGEAARRVNPPAWFAFTLYERVLAKLRREAVEDFRIDFEDGYGFRSDREEDGDAQRTAIATAEALDRRVLPPFFGIRIKPLTPEFRGRALRTLDIYLRTLLERTSGSLPDEFVVTLPKAGSDAEVGILVDALIAAEETYGLPSGAISMELMVENPRVLVADEHGLMLSAMIRRAGGRIRGLHLGLYDFLSSLGIVSSMQEYRHPSADHLRVETSVVAAAEHIWIADGAVNTIPVGLHRQKTPTARQREEDIRAVIEGWRLIYDCVLHSLRFGYYQGWDLHPSQMIPRYAALFSHFLREQESTAARLSSFLQDAARARRQGQAFDDIATGLGLVQFFSKGYACGALLKKDIEATGLTIEQIREGSFSRIIQSK